MNSAALRGTKYPIDRPSFISLRILVEEMLSAVTSKT